MIKLSSAAGQRGQSIRLTFEGKYLDTATEVISTDPGLKPKLLPENKSPSSIQADIVLPADTPAGMVKLALKTPPGQTAQLPFIVDLFPTLAEIEPNDSPAPAPTP